MPDTIKCITIHQPYASLIIGWDGMPDGIRKLTENRTWYTDYHGPLLIHAGKSTQWLKTWDGPIPDDMPMGAIIGSVTLIGCARRDKMGFNRLARQRWPWIVRHMHATGPFCWVLANPMRYVHPIPYKGQQGLFNVPATVLIGRKVAGILS